jgi:hypothetical protein
LVSGLFNDAFPSALRSKESNVMMVVVDESKGLWKEVVLTYFKVLFRLVWTEVILTL